MSDYNEYKYYTLTQSDRDLLNTYSVRTKWELTYVLIKSDKTFREIIEGNDIGLLPIICFGELFSGYNSMTISNTGKSRKYSEIDLFRLRREHFSFGMNYIIVDNESTNGTNRKILYDKMP